MHIKRFLFTALVLFALVGLASAEQVCTESEYKGRTIQQCRDTGSPGGGSFSDSFTDPRDGQTYRTVQIGNQIWMAENLNYRTEGSNCYDDKPANCQKYGRLYTWEAAQNACPSGWHLPSTAEFETLIATVGGEGVAAKVLKSRSGWESDGNGTDAYGFSALPAGDRFNRGDFYGAGYGAYFWSATEFFSDNAYNMYLVYDSDYATVNFIDNGSGFSVRCLRDSRL